MTNSGAAGWADAALGVSRVAAEWVDEALYPDWGQRFRVRAELARHRSAFQDIHVFDSYSHGRVMMLDGVVQITEADEFAYQEMIAHVPLFAHGAACRVLIIGAGDGGVLRRVLQHPAVQQATMVEIDADVIRLAREFLPAVGGEAWSDRRATVIVGDGIGYVANAPSASCDVIIVDSTDPAGPGEALFSDAFYADCARLLGADGLMVNQSGVPFMQADELSATTRRRARHFSHVGAFLIAAPTYVGGFMTIGTAGGRPFVRDRDVIRTRVRESGFSHPTLYWTPEMHEAAFTLPPYIARYVSGAT